MKREIKFRMWNSHVKEMNYNPPLWGSSRGGIDELNVSLQRMEEREKHSLMQFTGMKGDGQHDIYEGDICRWNTRDGSTIGTIIWEQQACAFWFKWFDGAAHRYKELRVNFSDGEFWLNDNIEVIGNIYENSELITVGGEKK